MNRATIKSEIKERLGETSEYDFWGEPYINRAIDEAVRRFSLEEKWSWLYTHRTAVVHPASSQTLNLEPDVSPTRHFNLLYVPTGETRPRFPKKVSPTEGFRLRTQIWTPASEVEYYYLSTSVRDDPLGTGGLQTYTYKVHLLPIPTRSLTIEYQFIRNPVEMTVDTDEPDVPEEYQEAIIAWATGQLWLKELNGSVKAQEQFNIYNAVLDQAREDMGALSPDELLIWGGEEPQLDELTLDQYRQRRILLPLG